MSLALLLIAAAGCGRESQAATLDPSPTSAPAPLVSAWCGEGWRGLDESTCLALPERFADPPSVVVFAHGILAPNTRPTADLATLLAASKALGVAVLVPRGKRGLCDWAPELAESYCWPVKRETVDRDAKSIVASWADAEERAAKVAGVRFDRHYLVGFSNGGYFASYVLTEGLAPFEGGAVLGSGRSSVDESKVAGKHPPLYLAVGEGEAESTRQEAQNLSGVLTRLDWPVTYVVHPQRGHELHQDDLTAAWAAWGR